MRRLFVIFLLIASIYAANFDFNLKLEKRIYSDIPPGLDLSEPAPQALVRRPLKDALSVRSKALEEGIVAVLNDYSDKVFTNLDKLMVEDQHDPQSLPSQHQGFNYTLLIDYHGELDLTNGWLDHLSTVRRGGDVVVSYSSNTRHLEITVPITFAELEVTYDYSAKIMGLGPKGGIDGKIKNLQAEVKLGFDTEKLEASLDEFYILNSGHVDFLFTGNSLVDWLLNLLTEVVTTLLKEVVLLVVEADVRKALGQAVESINERIAEFLNPSST